MEFELIPSSLFYFHHPIVRICVSVENSYHCSQPTQFLPVICSSQSFTRNHSMSEEELTMTTSHHKETDRDQTESLRSRSQNSCFSFSRSRSYFDALIPVRMKANTDSAMSRIASTCLRTLWEHILKCSLGRGT